VRVLAAPDKFRGTATASEVAAAVSAAVRTAAGAGSRTRQVPMSDGGEGFTEAFGGANKVSVVTGPLGDPTPAGWRLQAKTAVIEMAQASGLVLAGGAEGNDPIAASTRGTGELIAEALDLGARRIFVGHGGSATTDGGLAALQALFPTPRLRGVELIAAVDVRCRFLDAARVFAGQKGATPSQVELLSRRLERLAGVYLEDHGVDVTTIEGGGAAGGLAGGLAAVGAQVVSGFDLIAEELELVDAVEEADLVVTGEGFVDEASFDGKVVGGMAELAAEVGVPLLVIAGEVLEGALDGHVDPADDDVRVVSLVERFGRERALGDVLGCIGEVVASDLAAR
jgi:glycerate kinase